ncbi:MAG: hypothetical protein V4479_07350 [Actinomycetota bacterium]
MNRTALAIIASSAAVLVTAGIASPALAATPTGGLAAVQAAGEAATAARITALDTAIPKVSANAYLSPGDRSTILGTLNGDLSAMQSLQAKIAADTDVATAKTDVQSIYTGYRVYAVAIPQSLYAASADALTDSAIPALLTAQHALQAALAGPDKSKDTPAVDAQMADLATQITTAQNDSSGVSAAALSVTPSQFNADHSVLAGTRASIKNAGVAAKAATADAKAIRAALQ